MDSCNTNRDRNRKYIISLRGRAGRQPMRKREIKCEGAPMT